MHDRNLIWVTKKGENIKLKDMTDSHLQNAIKYVTNKKSNNIQESHLKALKQELRLRKLNNIENSPDYKDIF